MSNVAIPLAALIISVATVIGTYFATTARAKVEWVLRLETRVKSLEAELLEEQKERIRLEKENIKLLRQILLTNGSTKGHNVQ